MELVLNITCFCINKQLNETNRIKKAKKIIKQEEIVNRPEYKADEQQLVMLVWRLYVIFLTDFNLRSNLIR